MNSTRILIFVGFFFVINASGKLQNLKLCVVGNPKLKSTHTTKYCDLLGKSKKTPVSCVYAEDRLECLSAVSKREADFLIMEAEDLYFATKWSDSSILVVSEIKALKKNPVQYGIVVVVRKSSNINGIGDLRGKRLCHPGLDSGPEWNGLFAQYLEERVAPANCDENISVYEDRMKTTSDFFGSACKAGPWVVNKTEDARLKGKYWSLCALCDSGDCRNSEKYRGSGGSIICLKDGVGDILWARYEDVKVHLKFLEGESSEGSSDYHFLCDDGSVIPLEAEKPCLWLAKPWKVVGANRKSAADVQKIVEALGDEDRNEWEDNLLHVIELYLQYIQNVMVSKTPEDYLRNIPGYLSASVMSEGNCKPKHSVRLCVTSTIEEEKCLWMSRAAAALAIQPSLACMQKMNFSTCLKSVAEKETDVVVVPPDYVYDATMKFNLKSVLVEAGNEMNDSYLVSVVVKKKSEMTKLSELKGKKVCFTRRNGIGWKSVVAVLRQERLIDSECRDHEGLSEFFRDICVVSQENEEDLPACCSNIDGEDKEMDILRCLQKDGCDIAVFDLNSFYRSNDLGNSNYFSKYLKLSDFRAICKDMKECHWMWSYANYLMTSPQVESFKEEEIFNFFYQLGQFFGRSSNKNNNPMLEIFGPFSKVRNVIFKDTSAHFVGSNHWNLSNNYDDVVERMKLCSKSSLKEYSAFLIFASFVLSIHLFGNSLN